MRAYATLQKSYLTRLHSVRTENEHASSLVAVLTLASTLPSVASTLASPRLHLPPRVGAEGQAAEQAEGRVEA